AVEVFAAGAGRRLHVGTARPGDIVFGADPSAQGIGNDPAKDDRWELIAAGMPGSRLCAVGEGGLTRLARDPGLQAELAAAVDGWLALLLAELPHASPPQLFTELRGGIPVELAAGRAGRPRDGAVWIAGTGPGSDETADALLFLGEPELALGSSGEP